MYCGPDPEPDDLTFEEKLLYIPGGFTRPDCYLGRIRIAGVDRYGEAEELGEGELQLRNAFRTPGDMRGYPTPSGCRKGVFNGHETYEVQDGDVTVTRRRAVYVPHQSKWRQPQMGSFGYLRMNGFGPNDQEYEKKRKDRAKERFNEETLKLIQDASIQQGSIAAGRVRDERDRMFQEIFE